MIRNDATVVCPKCRTEIRLTESLAAPILEEAKRTYELQLAIANEELHERVKENRDLLEAIRVREQQIEVEVARRVQDMQPAITENEAKKAKLALDIQLECRAEKIKELENVVAERNQSLVEARATEVELRQMERRLEQDRASLELSIETRVNESLSKLRANALRDAEDRFRFRLSEKDQTIASMHCQIDNLRRKAEQGSERLWGEVQEIELERILRHRFTGDIIRPVAMGVPGADVIQHVQGPNGQTCGIIIWESKRTKRWSDGWLTKLSNDQRSSNADAAILISETLPKGLETFDLIDGVWVSEYKYIVPLATAIRHALIDIAMTRKAEEGQQTKMAMVYRYLTGQGFKQRVSAIVDQFSDMQEDLDRERRAVKRLWAKRESQIRGVIEATAGMYGDLQGIAGRSLQEVDGLDFKLPLEPRKLKQ